jgi:hypothetical protein
MAICLPSSIVVRSAIDPDALAHAWSVVVLRLFPDLPRFNGRLLLLADGIKVAKAGNKMPAVKKLHQESNNNTKPEYIMGHSCRRPRYWRDAATICLRCR